MQAVTAFDKDATDVTFFLLLFIHCLFSLSTSSSSSLASRATSRFSSAMKIQDEHDNSQRQRAAEKRARTISRFLFLRILQIFHRGLDIFRTIFLTSRAIETVPRVYTASCAEISHMHAFFFISTAAPYNLHVLLGLFFFPRNFHHRLEHERRFFIIATTLNSTLF